MIVKIFKINTLQMVILKNKMELINYIEDEIGISLSNEMKIKDLLAFLPKEYYYRMR